MWWTWLWQREQESDQAANSQKRKNVHHMSINPCDLSGKDQRINARQPGTSNGQRALQEPQMSFPQLHQSPCVVKCWVCGGYLIVAVRTEEKSSHVWLGSSNSVNAGVVIFTFSIVFFIAISTVNAAIASRLWVITSILIHVIFSFALFFRSLCLAAADVRSATKGQNPQAAAKE